MNRFEPPPLLEMTPTGEIRPPARLTVSGQVLRVAIGIAVLSGLLIVGALALWIALWLIPILLGAALVAYATLRFQRWRTGRR